MDDVDDGSTRQETYRITLPMRLFVSFFYVFASVIVVGVLVQMRQTDDRAGLPFLVTWSVAVVIQGSWMLIRMPWRIQTDDRGIRFLARTRKIEVPRDRLRSVSSPWYDMNRVSIRWRWEGGRLRTMGPWEHQHRLLTNDRAARSKRHDQGPLISCRAAQADSRGSGRNPVRNAVVRRF
jgi:hypothetical protein